MDSIVRICAGMGDGTGTKAGFIGKNYRGRRLFYMLKNMLPMMPPVAA